MDFVDKLRALAEGAERRMEHINTEEATKNALVMPFIQALGYDVFDPSEVVPEFVADVGVKKGEKVDYAIFRDGKAILLFECKSVGTNLDECHASQLYRYFSVTDSRVAVLTNGIVYRFFSDLEESNKLDSNPFLVFDLLTFKDNIAAELKMMTRDRFDEEVVVGSAGELKYMRGVRVHIEEELDSPSDDLIRLFASKVYSGRITANVCEQFRDIVKRAFSDVLRDRITERLQSALEKEEPEPEPMEEVEDDGIETTEEEIQGFHIVRAIMSEVIDPSRVTYRDRLSYFAIFLDDNTRQPICRLRFNTAQKYIGVFDEEKNEDRIPIDRLEDIYEQSDRLKAVVDYYD